MRRDNSPAWPIRKMRALLLLAAAAAEKSTWQHTNAFDRDLQDPKTRALLERRDRRDRRGRRRKDLRLGE